MIKRDRGRPLQSHLFEEPLELGPKEIEGVSQTKSLPGRGACRCQVSKAASTGGHVAGAGKAVGGGDWDGGGDGAGVPRRQDHGKELALQ